MPKGLLGEAVDCLLAVLQVLAELLRLALQCCEALGRVGLSLARRDLQPPDLATRLIELRLRLLEGAYSGRVGRVPKPGALARGAQGRKLAPCALKCCGEK